MKNKNKYSILAIDFGTKIIGMSITNNINYLSSILSVIKHDYIYKYIYKIIYKYKVKVLVIGNSINLNNKDNKLNIKVKLFICKIKKKFKYIEIFKIDERYTSKIIKNKSKNNILHGISSLILLNSYINRKKSK